MATFENPNELKLGRVSADVPLARARGDYTQQTLSQQLTSGLLELGRTIVGASIKQQRAKEFYEGQNRIIEASLQGTQQEELKRVLDEQPYYMQLLGNGAVAEGAVEAAARVGAGRIFNEQTARLAEGLDADIDPATYRNNLHAMIRSNMTGDERVDSIFIPQMVQKAQSVMAVHMQKNLEHNAKVAQSSLIQSGYGAIQNLQTTLEKEHGQGARWLAGAPLEVQLPSVRASYQNLVDTFNPDKFPKNIDQTKAIEQMMLLATSAAELGDTAVVQAVKESGMFAKLDARQIDALNSAAIKGKKASDQRVNLGNINRERELHRKVKLAQTRNDVDAVLQEATAIAEDYDLQGITRPDYLKDADAIKSLAFQAEDSTITYERHMATLNERTTALASEEADQNTLDDGILVNILGNNPKGKVFVKAVDGSQGLVEPTDKQVKDVYIRTSNTFASLGKEDQAAFLKRYGLKSIEELAWRAGVVDEPKQARVSTLLGAAYGKTVGLATSPKDAEGAIGEFFGHVDGLLSSIPNREDVGNYIKDEQQRKEFLEFMDVVDNTGNWGVAWNSTFGRDHSVKVDYNRFDLDDKIKKDSSVKDIVEAYGNDGGSAMHFVKEEARRALESRVAKDIPSAIRIATRTLTDTSEVIGNKRVLAVPAGNRIGARIGVKNQETVGSVTNTYVQSTLPDNYDYFLDFNPITRMHVVIPVNEDGDALSGNARPLDYDAVKRMVNDSKYLKEIQTKAAARKKPYKGIPRYGFLTN